MQRLIALLRSIAAAVCGYAVIFLGTSLGFKPLGTIVRLDAPLRTHILATLVAVSSGLAGGAMAAWVAGRAPVRHAVAVLVFLALDTAVVLSRPSTQPRWFELLGSATLMLATIGGGVVYDRVMQRRRAASAANQALKRTAASFSD